MKNENRATGNRTDENLTKGYRSNGSLAKEKNTAENSMEEEDVEEDFTFSGDWATHAKSLKREFPNLTDEDLNFRTGKEDDLILRLEKRLKKNRAQVIELLQKNRTSKR